MEPSSACSGCSRPIDLGDRFCRHCGRAINGSSAWLHNPWIILGLLFLIVGPLALPLLWKSNGFTRKQKVGVAVLNLVYTAVFVVSIGALVQKYTAMLLELSQGG